MVTRRKARTGSLDRILYFHAAKADPLLHDAVTEILLPRKGQGISDVDAVDLQHGLQGVHAVRLLLDTHTLLWFALGDPRLSSTAIARIMDTVHEKVVSPASYWEIAIKISVKKYVLSSSYEAFMAEAIDKNGFGYLHIEPKQTAVLTTLPFHHTDPFDRLLVAQALVEGLSVVSNDVQLDAYGVKRLW
jgi:PIN domain nuclease of toxin-antitoxin system